VCDAKQGLAELQRAGAGFKRSFQRWPAHLQLLRERHAFNYNQSSALIQAEYVLATLNAITRGNAIVTTGVGQHQMWAAQYLDFHRPRTFLTSGSMGTMGFGLPAAIGAQLANPGTLVIDVDGDGSIRMNVGELETLTTYDIPVKVLLLNNLGDGMVRQWQDLFYANRYSGSDKTLHKKDFVKAVEADGFGFARRADAKREAVEAGSAVNVEPPRAVSEEPVVGPGAPAQDRPVEAEAQEAELPAVRVARERQVDVPGRDVPEDARIVKEQQAEVFGAARMAGDELLDVLPAPAADPVRADDLDR